MAEDNKPIKYLRYAIGEILLVVIGILIALQINTWNQNRILQKEKVQFIKALKNDYVLDTLLLSEFVTYYTTNEEIQATQNNRAYASDANLDTIISLAQKDYNPVFDYINSFNTTTFNTLESTGKIELFNDEIKTKIITYNQHQNLLIERQKNNTDFLISKMNEYTNKYKLSLGTVNDNYLSKIAWRIDDEREFVILFTEMMGINRLILEMWKNQNNELLQETKEMIVLLEELEKQE